MTWILVTIIAVVFISSLHFIKEKYNPLSIFSGFWLLILFLSNLELFNINKAESEVYLIVSIGVLSYAIGCMFASRINVKYKLFRAPSQSGKKTEINYRLLNVISVIVTMVMFVYFGRVAATLLQGYPLNYIRSNFSSLIIHNEMEKLIWTFVVYPLSMSIMPMGLFSFYVERKHIIYFWVSLINTILLSICSGGRVYLMFYVIQFVFFTLYTKDRVNFRSRVQRRITFVAIAIGCILIMLYISNERQIQTSPIEGLYSYFTGCLPYMEFKIRQIQNIDFGYGVYFLYAPITLLLMILKNVGLINYPQGFLAAQATINSLQQYTKIGNNWFNAFATCFYYFYIDAGYFGVVLGSAIYGYISYKVFKSLRTQSNSRNIVLYSIILISIFTSMVRWQFARPEFFMSAFYVIILTRSRKNSLEEKYEG